MNEIDLIEVGDHVTVGNGTVHWVVIGLPELGETWATLESGMTDRRMYVPLRRVKLYRKGGAASVSMAQGRKP